MTKNRPEYPLDSGAALCHKPFIVCWLALTDESAFDTMLERVDSIVRHVLPA